MPLSFSRRARFAVLAVSTIALGLLVHRGGAFLAPPLRDVLGDALWAMMIAWWVAVVVPRVSLGARSAAALGICWAVEFSQLYHAPMVDGWRRSAIGSLVLGSDFDWRDLAAYALGILAAAVVERAAHRSWLMPHPRSDSASGR